MVGFGALTATLRPVNSEGVAGAIVRTACGEVRYIDSAASTNRETMSTDAAHPPCPYCGAPLPTTRSKQCLKCHYDWHDPQNVVRHADERWNRFGLDWDKQYVVELCQAPDGVRYTRYREVDSAPGPFAVRETEPASGKQFVDWGFYAYAEHLRLTDGTRFEFEAHGIWLTEAEAEYLWDESRRDNAPWVNGIEPRLPPA